MYWTLELASKLEDAPWPATKEELIDYVKEAFNNGIKQQYKDGISVEFVIKGDELIFVGGNEVNDYFIKLVE